MTIKRKKNLTSSQIIICGFACAILLGALILMLPVSSANGTVTPFADAVFTSTSAVCVTGLVVHDTTTHWSAFGQFIILLLIQIGGLGIVTVAVAFAMISKRKIGLAQRSTLQDAISAPKVGGIIRLTGFILKATLVIELLGAFFLSFVFCRDFGIKGIWYAIFHSVSAFCNAGFDLMGVVSPFSSLTSYAAQPLLNIVIMLLIIVGGIGFHVWDDVKTNKFNFKKYTMQTKVVLTTTFALILVPFLYFYFAEFKNLTGGKRLFSSLFQAVTPRTAGFNTADVTKLSGIGHAITIVLMLIGGSPGSTAGGMKTTTAAVLIFLSVSVFFKKQDVECFGRRIEESTLKKASAILLMYVILFFVSALVISGIEDLPLISCLYETASAIGTVGLTLGITSELGILSRAILICLMFFGRVGGLTLIFAAISNINQNVSKKPQEKITVG